MRELDFYIDVALTMLNCGSVDLERARDIINKTDEEIYNDFFDELEEVPGDEGIDPIAIAYEIILRRSKEELSELIDNAIEWYIGRNKSNGDENDECEEDEYGLITDHDKAIEEVCTYRNFLDTSYDRYGTLADFLKEIQFEDFLESKGVSISNSLKFFLEEIGVNI